MCAGDTQGIDRVMQRVKTMYEPIEATQFDVFDQTNAAEWKAVRAAFFTDNEDIKVGGCTLPDMTLITLNSSRK